MIALLEVMEMSCEVCGVTRGLDRHHVIPRRMGGTKDPAVHDEANLMTAASAQSRQVSDNP